MTCEAEYLALIEAGPTGSANLALIAAEENADMEAMDAGFPPRSERWFRIVMIGYGELLESGYGR